MIQRLENERTQVLSRHVTVFQKISRAFMAKKKLAMLEFQHKEKIRKVGNLQSLVRRYLAWKNMCALREEFLRKKEINVIAIQKNIRRWNCAGTLLKLKWSKGIGNDVAVRGSGAV